MKIRFGKEIFVGEGIDERFYLKWFLFFVFVNVCLDYGVYAFRGYIVGCFVNRFCECF